MIRLASVPACHPYVTAIVDPDCVSLLPDPQPANAELPGQWWPPRWLEPAYLLRRIHEIDALHIHFGFDDVSVEALSAVCDTVATHRVPLILTVHDLHNPHFDDPSDHCEKLGLLVAAADAVITLTSGAARVTEAQWLRDPSVIPHPHLLPLHEIDRPRARRTTPIVAVHGKALRANLDPWPVVDALSTADLPASIRFDLDDAAPTSPRAPRALAEQLERYAARGVDVRVHPPFSDTELGEYLRDIDVMVLPYRFGTHSGWAEICHDAGVIAVVPDCGYFHEQHHQPVFGFGRSRLDHDSLLHAVTTAVTTASCPGEGLARRRFRAQQRRQVRRDHVAIYRDAIEAAGARSAGRPPEAGGVITRS